MASAGNVGSHAPRPLLSPSTILAAFVPGALRNPLNGSAGRHWAVRARWARQWRGATAMLVRAFERGAAPDPAAPKRVTFVAHVWQRFDDDGLRAALKPVRDGLGDAGLIHDDSPRSGHVFDYRQLVDRRRRGVEIVVELLGEPASPPEGAETP